MRWTALKRKKDYRKLARCGVCINIYFQSEVRFSTLFFHKNEKRRSIRFICLSVFGKAICTDFTLLKWIFPAGMFRFPIVALQRQSFQLTSSPNLLSSLYVIFFALLPLFFLLLLFFFN